MIPISDEDYNRLPSCLNYVRSALDVNPGCKFGQAQQVNFISNHKFSAKSNEKKTQVINTRITYKNYLFIRDLGLCKLDLFLISFETHFFY